MISKLVILLSGILILFLFFIFYRFHRANTRNIFDRKIVGYEDIRAGDVFLVSFESISKIISDSMFKIQFIHPALVIEEKDQKYVIELMNYKRKTGFQKMELDEWIGRHKRDFVLLNKLEISSDQEKHRKEISDRIISFSTKFEKGSQKIDGVGGFNSSWWKYNNPSGGYQDQEIKNKITPCHEFCVYLLIKSGIVKPTKHVDYFHPETFIGMKQFDTNHPYRYVDYFHCDFSEYING